MSITTINRRNVMKASTALVVAPALLGTAAANAARTPFKIGLVNPITGPLAGFGEAADWIMAGLKDAAKPVRKASIYWLSLTLGIGALAIAIMLAAPKGIWGYVSKRWNIALFPVGYRINWKD